MVNGYTFKGMQHRISVFAPPLPLSQEGQLSITGESMAGPPSAVGGASDSRARGPGFDTRSGHKISFFLPLIQEG